MNTRILIALTVGMFCVTVPALALDAPQFHGFIESMAGIRATRDERTKHSRYNACEQRVQIRTRYPLREVPVLSDWNSVLSVKADAVIDEYFGAKTAWDTRELFLTCSPLAMVDLKLGRQILTWGTGDYLFVNDVFPKDYVSFYIGRDDEYLKKPSDAVRVSIYPSWANIDIAFIPVFEPNTLPEGDRVSFFDSFQRGIAGRDSDRYLAEPAHQAENGQVAARVYRTIGSYEAALYGYRGNDLSPRSYQDEAARRLYYERLSVYGASFRGPCFGGIGNAEIGYLRSGDDPAGTDRLIENSSVKALVGYERDLGNDLKVSVQYQYEQKLNYGEYRAALLPGDYFWDEYRHLVTQRVSKLFKNQTVRCTIFNFYSPSDRDGYLRCALDYAVTDQWKIVCGANLPWGEDDNTDFGQMKDNKNVFVRVRYSY